MTIRKSTHCQTNQTEAVVWLICDIKNDRSRKNIGSYSPASWWDFGFYIQTGQDSIYSYHASSEFVYMERSLLL